MKRSSGFVCKEGNVRVFFRCCPFRKEELSVGFVTVANSGGVEDNDLRILTGGSIRKNFKFDYVFFWTPKDDWVDVFADAPSMVISVLNGYDVRIFIYGQTGTGKNIYNGR